TLLGCGSLQIADRLTEEVGRRHANIASSDVSTDDETRVGADHIGDRLAPALSGAGAGRVNEPLLHQAGDPGRTRRIREVGGRSDLRPGDRALAKDRLEHGLLAELPQQAEAQTGLATGRTGPPISTKAGH